MVECPVGCPAERKGLRRWLEIYPRCRRLRTLLFRHQAGVWLMLVCGKLTHSLQASTRGRMSLRAHDRGQTPHKPAADTICHKFRSTAAGFWFSASKVPTNPSPTVTISAAATTAVALPACQTKLNVISRVTISQAAIEPEITPKTAVAKPIMRYSSA